MENVEQTEGVTIPEAVRNDSIEARWERGQAVMEQLTGSAVEWNEFLSGLAPEYAHWVMEFALGQVWSRPGLDLKTRSLVTVAALTVQSRAVGLKTHIRGALNNGATRQEVVETILHMTVYGGFPDAWDALAVARQVFAELDERPAEKVTPRD